MNYDDVPGVGLVSSDYLKLEPWLMKSLKKINLISSIDIDNRGQIYNLSAKEVFNLIDQRVRHPSGLIMTILNPFEYLEYMRFLKQTNPTKIKEIEEEGKSEILDGKYDCTKKIITPGTVMNSREAKIEELLNYKESLGLNELDIYLPHRPITPAAIFGAGTVMHIDNDLESTNGFGLALRKPLDMEDRTYATYTIRPVLVPFSPSRPQII